MTIPEGEPEVVYEDETFTVVKTDGGVYVQHVDCKDAIGYSSNGVAHHIRGGFDVDE